MNHSPQNSDAIAPEPVLKRRLVLFLATSVGVIVANAYYVQPILAELGREFALTPQNAGQIVMTTQLGTALGMLTVVPLGDTRELRSLITTLLGLATCALLAMATASSPKTLFAASFAVGMSTSIVHLIVPYAAHLAPESSRGRVVGTVLSGLLMGILLARTVSGLTAGLVGWRGVYWVAAGVMVTLAILVYRWLPRRPAVVHLKYFELLRSVVDLARKHAALRESAVTSALLFAAFSALWTTLAFLLEAPPFGYGPEVAGLFGLVGAIGAAGAPVFGRLTDSIGARSAVVWALLITLVGFTLLALFGQTISGLIVGILVMDLGVQSGHVANQTRIYGIDPTARGRLNTAYMVTYFTGGATGSALGAFFWQHAGWLGVCGFAISVVILGLVIMKRTTAVSELT
ncbi:MAG: hypothetical protein RL011_1258 [Pseudomonadota bacterium]